MMPFREALRGISFASTSNKRPSSSRTSSSSSTSSSRRLPSIEEAREECPTYDAICSTPTPGQTQEHPDDFFNTQSEPTRSYTENQLELEIQNESEPDEELPPYVLLDHGARKPAYSRHEAAATTNPEETQQEPSKLDGILCPRCNIKKAKTWYHQRQKERETR